MTQTLRIDLFTDMVCPWCLIGTARLDAALAKLGEDVAVEVHQHPFLLDPNTPEAGENTAERLGRKYGGDIAAMQGRVEEAARAAGVDLDLSVQPMSYSTVKAHTLVQHAPEERRYDFAKALAAAYFLEGRNISDPEVLTGIAEHYGVARERALALMGDEEAQAAIRAEAHEASHQGINGVPFFIFQGQFALSGAQPPEVFDRAFRVALGEEGL